MALYSMRLALFWGRKQMDFAKTGANMSILAKHLHQEAMGAQVISKTFQYLEQQSKDDRLKASLDLQKTVLNGATTEKGVSSLLDVLA
jgi:hypothetical protein